MDIKLEIMDIAQKSVLVQLMELYNYEFSEYEDEDVNEHGYYGYSHIDDYWNEEGRYPYLIRADGKIAGFALICSHCHCITGPDARCFGEFFVMLKYRRNGIGKKVALALIDQHKGNWEIMHLNNNKKAGNFWNTVINTLLKEKTIDQFSVCNSDNGGMAGFLFSNLT